MENNEKTFNNAETNPDVYTLLGSCSDFIGKHYELLNIDGEIMDRIKINFCRKEVNTYHDKETGVSHTTTSFLVSEKGGGWYRYYGNRFDRLMG